MYLPKTLCFINHSYKRGELRANKNADKSKNGVVGNKGKKIPTIPKAILIKPKITYNIFTKTVLHR